MWLESVYDFINKKQAVRVDLKWDENAEMEVLIFFGEKDGIEIF